MIVVGAITVLLRKLGYSPITTVFGFILGPILEDNDHRALVFSEGDPTIFITSPFSGLLLGLSLLVVYHIVAAATGFQLIDRIER